MPPLKFVATITLMRYFLCAKKMRIIHLFTYNNMKTSFEKFEKSAMQNLFSVKGGALIGGKTSTTTNRTVETTNDTDSNSGIEGKTSVDVVAQP